MFHLYVVCREKNPEEQVKYGMFPDVMFFTDKWINNRENTSSFSCFGSMWRPKVTSAKFYKTKTNALKVVSERGYGNTVYELIVLPEVVKVQKVTK